MSSENKSISTVLAIAVCALSLAVHAADNEWNVTASTEWSNSDNWSLSLDDTSNELRFRAGSGVLNSDVTVTFADAYEYPNRLKFENISTLDGSGLVTFRGNTDESGISITSGSNILVGWYGSGGYPANVEFAKGSYSIGNALLVQYGRATINGASLYCGGNLHLGYGNAAETTLNIFGGSVSCNGFYIGDKAGSKATCVMTNGTLTSRATGNSAAFIGQNGQGEFFFYGGKANFNGQFQIGRYNGSSGLFVITNGEFSVASYTCIGYNSGSGKFIMDGGTFTDRGDVFIVGQGSNASATGECIVSNGVLNVQSMYISEQNTCGTLTVEGGEVNVNGTVQLIRNAKSQTATVNLNGGVLSTERFDLGGGSGNSAVINFNGGTLKGVRSTSYAFIPSLGRLTVKLGEKGAIFDTAGFNLTVADTLDNADGLDHNAPIAKKGLGTLTISSDIDLDRTFKFVIDGGVGPIALTGSANTLGEGAKISVAIDPVDALTNTTYVLMTGVDTTYTKETSFDLPADNGFYTFDWTLEEGVLSVTLGYKAAAPFAARYVDAVWKTYDADGVLVEAEPCVYTTYIFTGTEPSGAFETISSDHKVVLEARKGNAEDAPVENTLVFATGVNARHVTVVTDEDCKFILSASYAGLTFAAQEFVNDGNFEYADSGLELGALKLNSGVFGLGGENTYLIPVPVGEGGLSIASGSVVSLDATGDVALSFNLQGSGTLRVKSGSGIEFNDTFMQDFTGTVEVPAGAWCGAAKDGNRLKTGTCKFRFAGGTAWFSGGNRNEFANDVEFVEGTSSKIQAGASNFIFEGDVSGSGEFTVEVNDRGVEFNGDNREFSGIANLNYGWPPNNMWNAFYHWNSASSSARWNLNCPHSGWYNNRTRNSYAFRDTSAENPMRFGALNVSASSTTITLDQETYVTVGERENDSSTINGRFVDNVVRLTKVGADSWLKLGTTFQMVAGSTLTVSAGGLAFNLPTDDTVTDLTGDTVTIDPSVKIRVAMTQAQYDDLDLNEEYLVAKLPTNPGYKPETELLVDGTVLDTPAAAKWGVRFKSFPAVGDTPAYVGAVLCRRSAGFMIIVY